jgi:hypothetical protein
VFFCLLFVERMDRKKMERNLHQLEDARMFDRLSTCLSTNWQLILTNIPNLEKKINKLELENSIRQSIIKNKRAGETMLLILGTRCFKLKDLFEAFKRANFNEGLSIILNRPFQSEQSLSLSSTLSSPLKTTSNTLEANISTKKMFANEGTLVKLVVTTNEQDHRLLRYQWFKENDNHQLDPVKSITPFTFLILLHFFFDDY